MRLPAAFLSLVFTARAAVSLHPPGLPAALCLQAGVARQAGAPGRPFRTILPIFARIFTNISPKMPIFAVAMPPCPQRALAAAGPERAPWSGGPRVAAAGMEAEKTNQNT